MCVGVCVVWCVGVWCERVSVYVFVVSVCVCVCVSVGV